MVDRDLRPVPVLAGTTRDEGTLFTNAFYDRAGTPLTETGFRTVLAAAAGSQRNAAGRAYRVIDRSPGRAWSDVITDRAYACTSVATYQSVSTRAPLFAYEFADPTAPSPYAGLPPDLADGVAHGAEMPYLFDLVPGPAHADGPAAGAGRGDGAPVGSLRRQRQPERRRRRWQRDRVAAVGG